MPKNQIKGKRVLVVSQHFWPETFRINDICDYLVEEGVEVDVLCGIPNYPKGQFFSGYGLLKNRTQTHNKVTIRRAYEIPRGNNSNLRILLNYISFPISTLFHIPRLLTKKYDKIFLYQTSPVLMIIAGLIVGKIRRTETTLYVLDLWPENLFSVLRVNNRILIKLATVVSHWHYKKADKIIVLSEKMKEKIQNVTGIPENKITVLIQTSEKVYETDIIDKKLSSRFNKTFNITFAGNISPAQSLDTLIKSAVQLKEEGYNDIRWIIVGDGMSRSWLESEVKKNKLSDIFFFEGQKPIEDVPRYTTISDVLIGCLVKSDLLDATIPAKVMSYLAAGKPMVLAMDGEVQELINNTIQCGKVGPTEDHTTLSSNIKYIYNLSPSDRKKMGDLGRAYHFEHFERNIILKKLVAFMFNS